MTAWEQNSALAAATASPTAWLHLLQLTNATLPVGAYSYSEGVETLVQQQQIQTVESLYDWLAQELQYGGIRLEAAVMSRADTAVRNQDAQLLSVWNQWLSAARETEELREQSWQMGRALARLLPTLQPETQPWLEACGLPCNFAIAFGISTAVEQIDPELAMLGYLHSWASNLVNAGVRLIPLGQTAGQQLIQALHGEMTRATEQILALTDDELSSGGWGLAIASMQHETLYSRLFRS